ncbi:MAG: 8-hydroxy-5-deazaflavin:NADPH oxidoreductase [Thermoplasmata archaeon]|jgi:predicted dinucleotide-binding enzyme|nr:8-hydroxy-5-deazaflavin:NADPH oxidoreductase [Thermoplasmata archaeon]
MRVGVIGSGGVGQILAAGFQSKGYEVLLGTRDLKASLARTAPDAMGTPPLSAFAKANPKVKLGTFAEAAKHGEVLVFAIHGAVVAEAVRLAGPGNLAGKLVLDTSNPLDFTPSGLRKHKAIPDSCLQVAQRAAPKAHFVKAWNCTPGGGMVNPKQGPGDQLICGDDAKAKEQAARILKEFGWRVADAGGSDVAPYVEATALAICNYALKTNDWNWILSLPGRAVQ